jgi:MtN3 and saliva related transmembrane protein
VIAWELVGAVAAMLTMFGFVPQILKMHRCRSVKDVSLPMLLQFSTGVFLWLLYGLYLKNNILIVSNFVSLATLIVALGLYFRHCRTAAGEVTVPLQVTESPLI